MRVSGLCRLQTRPDRVPREGQERRADRLEAPVGLEVPGLSLGRLQAVRLPVRRMGPRLLGSDAAHRRVQGRRPLHVPGVCSDRNRTVTDRKLLHHLEDAERTSGTKATCPSLPTTQRTSPMRFRQSGSARQSITLQTMGATGQSWPGGCPGSRAAGPSPTRTARRRSGRRSSAETRHERLLPTGTSPIRCSRAFRPRPVPRGLPTGGGRRGPSPRRP